MRWLGFLLVIGGCFEEEEELEDEATEEDEGWEDEEEWQDPLAAYRDSCTGVYLECVELGVSEATCRPVLDDCLDRAARCELDRDACTGSEDECADLLWVCLYG